MYNIFSISWINKQIQYLFVSYVVKFNFRFHHLFKQVQVIMSEIKTAVLLIYLIHLMCLGNCGNEIFIDYGVGLEGAELLKFFHGVTNGFYVDIGGYDAIFASNTLNLMTMGWDGINIDAHPARLARINRLRPGQANLNYAIGQEDQIVTLYEVAEDSSSTISPKVKEYIKSFKPLQAQIKIPSMTIRQLCERFYFRKPTFMNLDIEGYGGRALLTNDWNNPKCVPDVIFSEINEQTKQSGFPLPQVTLTGLGYKKWPTGVGLNQIYIHGIVYQKYKKNYEQGKKEFQKKQNLQLYSISSIASTFLRVSTFLVPHYQPISDGVYYHFTKLKQVLNLDKINKYSNELSATKNRPIMVLHFDPRSSYILLQNNHYSVATVTNSGYQFHNITVYQNNLPLYSCYILNHHFQPETNPKIIIHPSKQSTSVSQNQPNILQQSSQIGTKLQNYNSMVNTTNQQLEVTSKQVRNMIISNHQYDKSKLQAVLAKIQSLDKQYKSNFAGEYPSTNSLMETIEGVVRSQVFILLFIFFINATSCLLVCIDKKAPSLRQIGLQISESQSKFENNDSSIQSEQQSDH